MYYTYQPSKKMPTNKVYSSKFWGLQNVHVVKFLSYISQIDSICQSRKERIRLYIRLTKCFIFLSLYKKKSVRKKKIKKLKKLKKKIKYIEN